MISHVRELLTLSDFCPRDIILTHDERFIVMCKATKISVYSIETRHFLSEIETTDQENVQKLWVKENQIFALTKKNIFEVSLSVTPSMLRLHLQSTYLLSNFFEDSSFVLSSPSNSTSSLIKVTEDKKAFYIFKTKNRDLGKVKFSPESTPLLAFNDNLIVVVTGSKIKFISHNVSKKWIWHLQESTVITAITIHETDFLAATGDNLGKILVWQKSSSDSFFPSICHWHSNSVAALHFNGSYLYSGGHEEVLLQWSLNSKDPISTVPRLGAPIKAIMTLGDKYLALTMANNSIQFFLHSNLCKVFDLNGPHLYKGSIKWFSPLNALLIPYSETQLQFIDLKYKRELFRLEIYSENKVTGQRQKESQIKNMNEFEISDDGSYLATAVADKFTIQVYIWKYCCSKKSFSLDARLREGKDETSSIALSFVQSTYQLMLGGSDQEVKIWSLMNGLWNWDVSLNYKRQEPQLLSSSSDGSVIAISFGSCLTLWKNHSFELLSTLSTLGHGSITSLVFGSLSNSDLCFASTNEKVLCWNLLTLTLVWKLQAPDSKVYRIPGKSLIGIVEKDNVWIVDRNKILNKSAINSSNALVFVSDTKNIASAYLLTNTDKLTEVIWSLDKAELENISPELPNVTPQTKWPTLSTKANRDIGRIGKYVSLENIQCPLSSFALDFLNCHVSMYKDKFIAK